MRDQILDSYRVPEDRVHVVHNAVDTREFSVARRDALRAEMRARWSIPDDALCLLFLGHNFRLKGLWETIGALRTLESQSGNSQRIHVLVAGRGTGGRQRQRAVSLVRHAGLEDRVTFAGAIRPSLHALAAADALIHLSWHDSFGFVVLEAMACGLPVISTRWTGATELIQNGLSGLIVDPGSTQDVADAIHKLTDRTCRSAMGHEAASVGARHDEVGNFEQVERVFEVASDNGRGRIEARRE
jgi:UDP-glucose:(heptosyl)LPS alpha-1,3-glucosyltransferase